MNAPLNQALDSLRSRAWKAIPAIMRRHKTNGSNGEETSGTPAGSAPAVAPEGPSPRERAQHWLLAQVRNKKVFYPALGVLLILILLLLFSSGSSDPIATADVKKGEFLVSIKSSGEIRAKESFTLTTPRMRYGQMQVVYLIPEGTTVKQGDVVVRFATTEVDKTIADKESELSILRSDLAKFKADESLRMSDLEAALTNAQLAYDQAKLQVEKMKFEAEVQRKEAEINLERNRIAFEQAKKKIASQKIVDRSEGQKYSLKVQQTEADLKRARADKEEYTLKATMAGLVVYEMNWSTGRKISVGDNPWPGMPVASLPNLSAMQSTTNVNEVDISKVKKGQAARVKLDAFPDRQFAASVSSVGTIGQQSDRSSNMKTFEVQIDIEGSDPVLKPGMTTSNELVMETIPDAVYVPLESVFEKDGKPTVYVMPGSSPRAREVTLGAKNSNFVVVTSGLEPGERVTLRDPTMKVNAGATSKQSALKK